MNPHVAKFFQFLEAKEGKTAPFKIKILNHELFSFTKDELDIKGSLDLSFTNITTLPKGLRVGWYLFLNGCTSLTSLPNGLRVGIDLDLMGCTSLRSVPDDLQVGNDLYLKNTPLAKMHSADEIRDMIESKGGYVKRDIYI